MDQSNIPSHWKIEEGCLVRTLSLPNFVEAVQFVSQIVPLAEKMNHHPDLEIFQYKKVKIKLITHSKNQITEKDTELAQQINHLWENRDQEKT